MSEAWERQPEESAKAYRAFEIYRDMGVDRSLSKATEAVYNGSASNMRLLAMWSGKHDWVRRAAAWDAKLAERRAVEAEEEHMRQLASFRERQRKMSQAMSKSALKLLKRADTRLEGLDPAEIPVESIPAFFRAVATVADSAGSAEAQALAVTELLNLLGGDKR